MEKKRLTQEEQREILKKFAKKFKQKDMPEDIAEIVNEKFWDLLY